jgi:tetratricopeptide (TPR) repeat protein
MNNEIIKNYESFVCDSAEVYINQNITLARTLGNQTYTTDSRLKLAFVYSLSGLFVQATEILNSIDYDALNAGQKVRYCWYRIRYYENYIKYTANPELSALYNREIDLLRERLLGLLEPGSEEHLKEQAFELQARGDYAGALEILRGVFSKQQPDTHTYAMAAMSLAKVYRLMGDTTAEDRYLKLAAITDLRFGVKENEALLALAMNLFERGDIERSYNYISVALADANFYNSRFRNTVIARVQPVIESNYLSRINRQRRNLIFSVVLVSVFGVGLIVALRVVSRQIRIVSKARLHLRKMNGELVALNRRLGEANIVKEKYIGHFMNRCVTYIDRLDTYRKDVNRKVKSGQFDRIYKPSDKELEKEIEELYVNFDEAFLRLYPDFVSEFNSLLVPGARYEPEGGRLNTELRIFALMRLGITNINQIAEFLHCSQQTIYNYRSKVRNRACRETRNLEEEVQRLCHIVP